MADEDAAMVLVIPPPPVPGIGTGGGFKLMIQDRAGRGPQELERATQQVLGAANGAPGIAFAFSLFNTATPQIRADIDRPRAEMLGLPISRVHEAMGIYMGSAFVNDFNLLGRTWRVTAQADQQHRMSVEDYRGAAGADRRGCDGAARQRRDLPRDGRSLPRAALQPVPGGRGAGRGHSRASPPARRSRPWSR